MLQNMFKKRLFIESNKVQSHYICKLLKLMISMCLNFTVNYKFYVVRIVVRIKTLKNARLTLFGRKIIYFINAL